MSSALVGPVHVIGTGLLGTSIGLALRAAGIPVWLSDTNPEQSTYRSADSVPPPLSTSPLTPASVCRTSCTVSSIVRTPSPVAYPSSHCTNRSFSKW